MVNLTKDVQVRKKKEKNYFAKEKKKRLFTFWQFHDYFYSF